MEDLKKLVGKEVHFFEQRDGAIGCYPNRLGKIVKVTDKEITWASIRNQNTGTFPIANIYRICEHKMKSKWSTCNRKLLWLNLKAAKENEQKLKNLAGGFVYLKMFFIGAWFMTIILTLSLPTAKLYFLALDATNPLIVPILLLVILFSYFIGVYLTDLVYSYIESDIKGDIYNLGMDVIAQT